ncbi:MAG: PucR family transcriptional regulator [Bacillota bacterium]
MEVKDALMIGDLTNATIYAGHDGVSREVLSVEVMEVPEVGTWVSRGILVLTTFYSIKEEPLKQIDIVRTLIEKEAAGIVIKLGRFVEAIPERMMNLANKHSFPIIVIPKEISYINVLTPLYEKLYEERHLAKESSVHPFCDFEEMDFPFLSDAIDEMERIVRSPIYVEDIEGRLLHASSGFCSDGWRASTAFFSQPDYPFYKKKLAEWQIELTTESHLFFYFHGHRNQLILPLTSKNELFAFVHIAFADQHSLKDVAAIHMKRLGKKLSEIFINEQLFLQKMRMEETNRKESYLTTLVDPEKNEGMTLVHFQANWMKPDYFPSSYLLDHSSLIRKKIKDIVESLNQTETLIWENKHRFYALIKSTEKDYPDIMNKWREMINHYNQENKENALKIAISSFTKSAASFDEQIRSVTKTMEIGCKVQPNQDVYTHDQLGIYEILIHLTSEPFVQNYTENVLYPLLKEEHKELEETLKVYLNENGNVSRASEKLYIHRRTMTYRITKIQELLNMDLDDAKNRFILSFCLNIRELS